MADADKTTAADGLIPTDHKPCTIAESTAYGGWSKINAPVGGTPKPRPMNGPGMAEKE